MVVVLSDATPATEIGTRHTLSMVEPS
jgi:hypothetical protein